MIVVSVELTKLVDIILGQLNLCLVVMRMREGLIYWLILAEIIVGFVKNAGKKLKNF